MAEPDSKNKLNYKFKIKVNIWAFREGCAKDPAARLCGRGGFGQGEPFLWFPHQRPWN
jgi:hypothetical protein